MDSVHFLVPFALLTKQQIPLLNALNTPGLQKILARAHAQRAHSIPPFSRTLAHEHWLTDHFGLTPDDYPVAPFMALADQLHLPAQSWSCLSPVHIHIALDHLILIDPSTLTPTPSEMQALAQHIQPIFDAFKIQAHFSQHGRWYLSHPLLDTLLTTSPLKASGRSVEIWLPQQRQGNQANQLWLQLQNEIQMAWFEHPVNQARQEQGLPTINSVWLHSNGVFHPTQAPWSDIFSEQIATQGLTLASKSTFHIPPPQFSALTAQIQHPSANGLIELHQLQHPFMQNDWTTWLQHFEQLDQQWFAPALDALARQQLREIRLTLTSENHRQTFCLKPRHLNYFWRRRPLSALITP